MSIHISPEWLINAWYGKTQFKTRPVLCIENNQLKVTVFKEHAIGMRSLSAPIQSSESYCYEIPDMFRAYIYHVRFAKSVELKFSDNNVQISVETPSFAIQYRIQHLPPTQDVFMNSSSRDIKFEVGTEDWLHICETMPRNGKLTIASNLNKRMITIKHSKNNWVACIMARTKALASKRFVCDSGVARFCFKPLQDLPAFGTLIFMDCGVLKWMCGYMQVYLAPQDDE